MTATNIIQTDAGLTDCIAAVAGWVAVDTEFMRARTYTPALCLIQITGDDFTACVDPLAVDDLTPLGALLADPAVTKIFHSCRQDLEAIDSRTDTVAHNVYDTQLAAAFCGYGGQASYAALVESLCAVRLAKSHTRTDWSRRPLSDAQLDYAVDDVKYLQPLRAELDRLLEQHGRTEWHRDECARAVAPANYRVDPQQAWRRLRGADRLDAAGLDCARRLAKWREQRAHRRNLPRGWILSDEVLLQVCKRRPATLAKLAKVKNIAPGTVKHAGKNILNIVAQSNGDGDADSPRRLSIEQRRRAREILDFIEARAEQDEISRPLVAGRDDIESLVRGQTDLPLLTGWRARWIGDEVRARYV